MLQNPATFHRPTARATGRWLPLVVTAIAQVMVVLDDTVVNLALPAAAADLRFSTADRQWVITGYAAAFAAVLLIGGRLVDRYGPRRTLALGATAFALASALGAAAPTLAVLVAARVLQGMAAGVLAPAALAALSLAYPSGAVRARAFAVFAATSACGAVVGLVLGGLLAGWSWRLSLLINVVIVLPVLLGARVTPAAAGTSRPGFGVGDSALALGGLLLLIGGLGRAAWQAVPVSAIAVGLLLLVVFWLRQRSSPRPLLPVRLLTGAPGAALLALLLGYCGMFAVFVFLTFVLQVGLGFSPLVAGIAYLPMTAAIGVSAGLSARSGLSPGTCIPVGMLVAGAGLGWLSLLRVADPYWVGVLGPTIVLGAGLGMVFTNAVNLATGTSDDSAAGTAAALVNVAQQTGVAIGTALLSGVAQLVAGTNANPYPGAAAAFVTGAGIFLVGAIVVGLLLRRSHRRPSAVSAVPS